MENTVTIATVLKKVLKNLLLSCNVYCILFGKILKYNIDKVSIAVDDDYVKGLMTLFQNR